MASEAMHLELGAEAAAAARSKEAVAKAAAASSSKEAQALALAGSAAKEVQALTGSSAREMQVLAGSAAEEESKPEEGSRIVRLPDWCIKRIQKCGARRPSPLPEGLYQDDPEFREMVLACKEAANALVDVEEDILMQVRDKGYAEVMVEYVDGVPKFGIVPKPDDRTEDVRST